MRRQYNTNGTFVDLLFNVLIGFFMLLLLAIALIKPETNKKDVELKAEYIITMVWPDDNKNDVDLMVKTPLKEVVWYHKRDVKSASLDRDDLGWKNDVVTLDDGTKFVIKENYEHVTLRKTFKGEYIVNIVMFRKEDHKPTPVTVKVEKLNPYRLVFAGTVNLDRGGQEKTVIRFKVDSKGNVIRRSAEPYSIRNTLRKRPGR